MINRILGLLVGFALAGPLGGFIGFLIGLYIDKGLGIRHQGKFRFANVFKQQFLETMFILMGHVAKADGRISELEITHARNFMQQIRLSETQKEQAIRWFYQGKNQQFNLDELLLRLRPYSATPHIRLLVRALADIISVNGKAHPEQQRILVQICDYFGLPHPQFHQYQQYNQYHYQHAAPRKEHNLAKAYLTLGITVDAKEGDIRKAYRRLLSKHHPDKVSARGGNANEIKIATEKTHQIRTAYEQIMQARGTPV